MATAVTKTCADILTSESHQASHLLTRPSNSNGSQHSSGCIGSGKIAPSRKLQYILMEVGPSSRPQPTSMPMSTGSQSSLLASLPSFASVFGDGAENQKLKEVGGISDQGPSRTTTTQTAANKATNSFKRPNSAQHFFSPALRRDSASTFESVESSPTTTISTIESSLTEPSPSSSPESPNSLLPSLPLKTQRTNPDLVTLTPMEFRDQFSSSFPHLPGVNGSESPNKKMRNTKNLSVNTSASNRQASQLSKLSLSNSSSGPSGHVSSAPPTPAFIVPPPKAPKKKPSSLGLTITTPDSSDSSVQHRPVLVPQTPSDPQIRTLRALQTVSSGPLFSPTHAPEGGMRLPPLNSNASNASRFGPASRPPLSVSPHSSFDAAISSPITKQTLDHVQEETDYELPLSQEAKSPAYPQGPICIYDPNVYLYLEPTRIEASEFDVVFNVAREVTNPFAAAVEKALVTDTIETQAAHLAGRENISEPHTAVSEQSFSTAFDTLPGDVQSTAPATPKASRPQPEYIHVPWDHNTNVVDDLLRLCELIDDRVRQNKRILVHCQCGVSRSASLVVAYGLYKNPRHTVQEAYDAVKNRSRWIGPNMNLIYQLSEFKTKLGQLAATGTHGWPSWQAMGPPRPSTSSTLIPEMPTSSLRNIPQKSLSAPSQLERPVSVARASSFNFSGSEQLVAEPIAGDITPGPSSAPPGMTWSPETDPVDLMPGTFPVEKEQPTSPTLPRLMEIDTDMSLSPFLVGTDAFEQKEKPPAGAVASDLQEVAKDLADKQLHSRKTTADKAIQAPAIIPPPPRALDSDSHNGLNPQSHASTNSTLTPSSEAHPLRPQPSLPAGFSSLLTRRQNTQQLPIRQEAPRFTAIQIAQSFNPELPDNEPPTPSLLSPRAAEFTASPFHRTAAGDLAGSSVFEQGLRSPRAFDEDPRSPHQVGEAPITRNIFDMLGFGPTPR